MLKRTLLLLSIIAASISAKCDTIDFWHVYYNKDKKIECTEGKHCILTLHRDSLKANDTITIYYFNDTGYQNGAVITDGDLHKVYTVREKVDSLNGFSVILAIPVRVLIASQSRTFTVYFKDDNKFIGRDLLRIAIE